MTGSNIVQFPVGTIPAGKQAARAASSHFQRAPFGPVGMPVSPGLSFGQPVSRQSDAPSRPPDGERLAHPERTHSALPARAGIFFDQLQELFWDVLTAVLVLAAIFGPWVIGICVVLRWLAKR
jgi:hypothetical protein